MNFNYFLSLLHREKNYNHFPQKHSLQKHKFAFTGLIRCGECGCLYTAETKKKFIKGTGEVKEYTYYHCTRKTRKINCTQRKFLLENNLEVQIEKELDELTRMRYRQLIDDEAFIKERNSLQTKLCQLKGKVRETEIRAEQWLELTEKTFNFATYARKAFLTGGLELKKEILMALGKNPIIKDGKLFIEPNEWFVPIKNDYPALEKEYLGLEPQQTLMNKGKTEALASVCTHWLPLLPPSTLSPLFFPTLSINARKEI